MVRGTLISFVALLALTGCGKSKAELEADHIQPVSDASASGGEAADEADVDRRDRKGRSRISQDAGPTSTATPETEPELDYSSSDASPSLHALGYVLSEPSPEPMESRPRPSPQRTPMPARRAPLQAPQAGLYQPPPAKERTPNLPPVETNVESFSDYGINGFDLTEYDRLSTFSIDVDSASYTLVRRKLNEGYLPPEAAVRVEEFVNYFPYEYQRPTPGHPFAVDFEATPSPWNPQNHMVRIGVQAKKVSYEDRKPVHLTFLVDTSGSMRSDDKIGLVKKTLKMLTEELEDGDTVAIATYAGSTEVVLAPTSIGHRAEILRSLDRMTAGGSTAMDSGIDIAYRLADKAYVPGAVNRVIVCSDGDANVGRTSHEQISKQIRGYAEKGVTLTTLGFGTGNYKDTMMERLANDGDGNYFYLDGEAEARRIFVDKLNGTMEVVAKDVKIQVDWDPEAVIGYRLVGYENRDIADRDFRNDKVDAGEIGAGHQVTAVYEVMLRDELPGQLAAVRIRNKAPGPDSPAVERSYGLSTDSLKDRFEEGSDQYRIAVAAASFAEILRGSPHMAEVTLRDVERVARNAQRPEYREDGELVQLIGRAAQLRGEGVYSSR